MRKLFTAVVVTVVSVLAAFPGLSYAGGDHTHGYNNDYLDDDNSIHEASLGRMSGHASGLECGEHRICPDRALKRWELAVWLGRALTNSEPDVVENPSFVDVDPDVWWSVHVERFYNLGVTVGCQKEPLSFCPHETVNRAQMATFLARAFDVAKTSSAGFVDVRQGSVHADSIDAIAAARITSGCSLDPYAYCPDELVTRGQAATFMVRGLALTAEATGIVTEADGVTRYVVPTLFCAPAGAYTQETMEKIVADLGNHVNEFYLRESSGMADVRLRFEGSVSPDVEWDKGFSEVFQRFDNACHNASFAEVDGNTQILILAGTAETRTAAGQAWYNTGPSAVALTGRETGEHSPDQIRLHAIAAHELGHSLFGWHHLDEPLPSPEDCKPLHTEIMLSGGGCYTQGWDELSRYSVSCSLRQLEGWPCAETVADADVPDVPVSSYGWRSFWFEFTEHRERGIRIVSPPKEDGSAISMFAFCTSVNNVDRSYNLRFAVTTAGKPFHKDWDQHRGSILVSVEYLNEPISSYSTTPTLGGDTLVLGDPDYPRYADEAARFMSMLINRSGETMILSFYDDNSDLFEAAFDTTGADVAVQSVMNLCGETSN